MSHVRYGVLVMLVVVAGCVGGAVSQRLRSAPTALAGTKPEVPEALEAQQFRVVDVNGTIRAVVGMSPTGATGIIIKDEKGNRRVALELAPTGASSLTFFDESGHRRAYIDPYRGLGITDKTGEKDVISMHVSGHSASGEPELCLGDLSKGGAIWLRTLGDGSPELSLWDAKRKDRALLRLRSDGNPELAFYDDNKKRIGLDLSGEGQPRFSLFAAGTMARPRTVLTADLEGWPSLQFQDKHGNRLGSMVVKPESASGPPAVEILDGADKVIEPGTASAE